TVAKFVEEIKALDVIDDETATLFADEPDWKPVSLTEPVKPFRVPVDELIAQAPAMSVDQLIAALDRVIKTFDVVPEMSIEYQRAEDEDDGTPVYVKRRFDA